MVENKIWKKNYFPTKTWLGEALFPPLVKAKNQRQNFEKQQKMAIRRLIVPNFCYFWKKSFDGVKRKNCTKEILIFSKNQIITFTTSFGNFYHQNLIFFKNKQNFDCLIFVLFKVFFKNLCWFLPFTEGGKSASPKQILARNFFL